MPSWNKNVTWEEARSQTLTSFIDVPLLLRVVIFARKKCIRKNQNCKYFFFQIVSQKNCLATLSLLLLLLLLLLGRSRITKGGCVADKLLKPCLENCDLSCNSVTSQQQQEQQQQITMDNCQ